MKRYWPLLVIVAILAAVIGVSQYAESTKQRCEEAARQTKAATVAKGDDGKASNNTENPCKPPAWARYFTWPEGVGAWAVILTLFVIAWQSIETAKAAKATEKSVVLAAEAAAQSLKEMQLEQRAWVGVTAASLVEFAPNKLVTANLTIKNMGKTFAVNATLFQRILSVMGRQPLTQFPETSEGEPGITLLPGAEFIAQVMGTKPLLSVEQFNAIQAGNAFIYMYGTIRYKDVMGYSHRTQFSFVYSPIVRSFQAYQGHNDAD
jgi:hypothetical protein